MEDYERRDTENGRPKDHPQTAQARGRRRQSYPQLADQRFIEIHHSCPQLVPPASIEQQQSCPIKRNDEKRPIKNTDKDVSLLQIEDTTEVAFEEVTKDKNAEIVTLLQKKEVKRKKKNKRKKDTTDVTIEEEIPKDVNAGVMNKNSICRCDNKRICMVWYGINEIKTSYPFVCVNKIVLPILLAIIFGIGMSTFDIWTDWNLFNILYSNGQKNWGFLILVPIFANTFFTLCSMLYTRGFKSCKKASLAIVFTIFVLLQLYPQLCTVGNLLSLVRVETTRTGPLYILDMAQFEMKQSYSSGTLGTLESFVESTPTLYIQTAFLAHTGLSLSKLKQKTCFKLNCHNLDAQQEECKKVNQTDEAFGNMPNINADNATEYYENLEATCKQNNSELCQGKVETCISQLDVQLADLTLKDLHLNQTEKWKNTTLHKNYDMSKRDLDTVALHFILFKGGDWTFWRSYIMSYFSAAYGITSYLKNGSGRFISNMGGTFAKVFGAVLLSLLWKVFYLYSLVRYSGLSEFLNIFFWILTCFLPQLVYIFARVYLKCPQAFTSLKNFLIFKQPQVFLLTCISPVAYDVEIKSSDTESFAIFKVSETSTWNANMFQAIISLPFILKLILFPLASSFFPAWIGWMKNVLDTWPQDGVILALLALMFIVSVLAVVITITIYFVVFCSANMILLKTDIFDKKDNKPKKCVLHEKILCKKCHAKIGVVFDKLSADELEAQEQKEKGVMKLYCLMKAQEDNICIGIVCFGILGTLVGTVSVGVYWWVSY